MSKALLLFLCAISSTNFNVTIFHLRIQAIDTTFSGDIETVVTWYLIPYVFKNQLQDFRQCKVIHFKYCKIIYHNVIKTDRISDSS